MPYRISRSAYADIYGPTTGDKVRLGDTSLMLEVEKDFAVYGDECKFGGGKTLREGMGQAAGVGDADALDCVITNALIVDYTGIYKADIGIKDGLIAAIGKGGQSRCHGRRHAGHDCRRDHRSHRRRRADPYRRRDRFAHSFHLPAAGARGDRRGPHDDGRRRHRAGHRHLRHHLHAGLALHADDAAGDRCPAAELRFYRARATRHYREDWPSRSLAGAIGLKLHEDWGTTPAAIDCCLSVADEHDVQATIHTDTLNESGFVEAIDRGV